MHGKATMTRVFGFGQPRLASRTWLNSQSIDALLIETRNVNADSLGMAVQFRRNLIRCLARLAFHRHTCVPNPIGGGMLAACQFANLSFLSLILRRSCFDIFWYHSLLDTSTSYCSPIEEWSISYSGLTFTIPLVTHPGPEMPANLAVSWGDSIRASPDVSHSR